MWVSCHGPANSPVMSKNATDKIIWKFFIVKKKTKHLKMGLGTIVLQCILLSLLQMNHGLANFPPHARKISIPLLWVCHYVILFPAKTWNFFLVRDERDGKLPDPRGYSSDFSKDIRLPLFTQKINIQIIWVCQW